MNELWIWITILGMVGVTLATRAGFLLLPERVRLPSSIQRALRYAPACALTAIILPDLALGTSGAIDPTNPRLIAAAIAVVVFLWTRDMVATIVAGVLAFNALRLLAGHY